MVLFEKENKRTKSDDEKRLFLSSITSFKKRKNEEKVKNNGDIKPHITKTHTINIYIMEMRKNVDWMSFMCFFDNFEEISVFLDEKKISNQKKLIKCERVGYLQNCF